MNLSLPPRRIANPARSGVRHATLIGIDRPPMPLPPSPLPAAPAADTPEPTRDPQPVAERTNPPARSARRPRDIVLLFVASTAVLLVLAALGRHHFSHAEAAPTSEAARLSARRAQAAIEAAALLTTQTPVAPVPPIPLAAPIPAVAASPAGPPASALAPAPAASPAALLVPPMFPAPDARAPSPEHTAIEPVGQPLAQARPGKRESALPLPFGAIAVPAPSKAVAGRAPAPIPDLIEGESAASDPLARIEIEGSLKLADAAAAPFEVGKLRADGPRRQVELLTRGGDGSATSAWYEVGQSTPSGWIVVRISDESVDLLTPRGNPARLLHPAPEPR